MSNDKDCPVGHEPEPGELRHLRASDQRGHGCATGNLAVGGTAWQNQAAGLVAHLCWSGDDWDGVM